MDRFRRGSRKRFTLIFILLLFMTGVITFFYNSKFYENPKNKLFETVQQNSDIESAKEVPIKLALDSTSYNLKIKQSRRISITAKYSDGSTEDVTKLSHYSTSNDSIVKVDSTGLITAIKSGFANITVNFNGFSEAISVAVSSKSYKVNVRDFGAFGDGAVDNTSAFQNAIDEVATKGGGDVYVPAGTYLLHPIFLKSSVNLVGENKNNVILKLSDKAPDDYTRIINIENVSNVKVQGITCDGNSQNHPNGIEHMHCIFVWDSKNILIDNNRLINAVGDGVSISGSKKTSEHITISNNILKDNGRSNIVLEQVSHLQIFNNQSRSKIGRPALHFEPWEEMSFYEARIWNNTFVSNTSGYCVQLEGGQGEGNFYFDVEFYENNIDCPTGEFLIMETKGAMIHSNNLNVSSLFVWIKNEDLNIYNNQIESQNGIVIEGTWGMLSKRTVISDNSITTSGYGVHIKAGSQDTKIIRNTFKGTGGTSIYFFASVTNISGTVIAENIFKNFDYGIFTDYNFYDNKYINGLMVRENTFSNLKEYAIYIKGTSKNVKVLGNIINNASGVYIAADDGLMMNIEISNNTISGGKRGILQKQYGDGSLNGLTISKNTISNTTDIGDGDLTGAAIELYRYSNPPTNVSIKNNVLFSNPQNIITVPDSILNSVNNE